jgi:hypothetical protein
MRFKLCDAENLRGFIGEIAIHFPGPKNIDIPTVFVSPELVICLACGHAQFTVPEDELRKLTELNAVADRFRPLQR